MNRNLYKIYNLLERIDTQYRDYTLLTESQESKSISAAKKLAMDRMGWDEQRADKFVREELRGDLPALRTRNGGKFILGVARMFLDRQLTDGGIIQRLNRTIELVASDAHINEYDRNLNGMSADELINRFSGTIKDMTNKDREAVNGLELQENNDYTIVQIDDFEQAEQYGQYTSWCVTHYEDMLDSYTSGGIGQFYFCLKNGFENVPKEAGENCPLDEYGLSMVAVSVDETGRLNTCTCRWNHDCGGDDHIMDTKQISQLIGRNFYDVFKPNNKWESTVEEVIQRLANGENPYHIFNEVTDYRDYMEVKLKQKRNYLRYNSENKLELVSPNIWFDYCYGSPKFGFLKVEKSDKFNLINIETGEFVTPNLWYDAIENFSTETGYARINLNGKRNLINTKGQLLSPNMWFDTVTEFEEGFWRVKKNNKWDYIDTNGNLLMGEFMFFSCDDFYHGIARVRICKNYNDRRSYNLIDYKGNILLKEQYDTIGVFHYGFALVKNDEMFNFINKNFNLLSPNLWFDFADDFNTYSQVAPVEKNKKWNFIKQDGTLLLNWTDAANLYNFNRNDPSVMINGSWYQISNAKLVKIEENQKPKTITITESQYKEILNESQEAKSISAAKQLLKSKLNMSEEQANKFVRQDIRQQFPVLHHNSKAGKFILGLTRMLLNDNIAGNAQALQRLNATIELISNETHIKEYDRNLNGMSAQELIDRFSGARKEKNDKDREEVNSMEYQQNNDYTIVQIDNFEQSSQYGQYTSWCVTHNPNMLDSYTSDGIGQFYFCLKNGFENVPQEPGENCPLDEYGLSMVAVSVDEDGNLNTCTCRWNHNNGGNDSIMDTKQVSQLIGRNFYEVFKPNNKWKNEIERVTKELATNKKLDYIFDMVDELSQGYYMVGLSNRYNIVKGRKLLSSMWFKYLGDDFNEGFIVVQDNDFKYNLLSKNGELISETWFDECNNFNNGYALVLKEDLGVNFIDKKGNYLSETWFNDASDMDLDSNIAWVMKDEGCNFITTKGTFLFDTWYDYVDKFYERDYTTVRQDWKYNIIFKNGQLLSKTWFDSIKIQLYNSKLAHVRIGNKYNILNINDGQLLSAQWFDNIQCIFTVPELNLVRLNDKLNVIDKNGNLVYDKWYSSYEDRGIDDYTAIVSLNKKYCLIAKLTGERMTRWFDYLFKLTNQNAMYGVLKGKAVYEVYYDGTTKLIKDKV